MNKRLMFHYLVLLCNERCEQTLLAVQVVTYHFVTNLIPVVATQRSERQCAP